MSISAKVSHALRDAFSYAVHQESADDFARKPYVVASLVENSKAALGTSDAAAERLSGLLSKVRTQHLDIFVKKNVTLGLDAAYAAQGFTPSNERSIEGVYFPAADGNTGVATLYDNGRPAKGGFFTQDVASYGVTFVEKLANRLAQGEPKEALYAARLTTIDAAGGMGLVAIITTTAWETKAELGTAAPKAAAFSQRPVKPQAPTPN